MKKNILALSLFGLFLISTLAFVQASEDKYVSVRASGGDIINIAHFREFTYEKVDFSFWARIGKLNGDYVAETLQGNAGLQILGRTSGGNRVTVNSLGSLDLMYYSETQQFTDYVYEGNVVFKTGKLMPQIYQVYVWARQNKENGEFYMSGMSIGFDRLFMVRHMDVTTLK